METPFFMSYTKDTKKPPEIEWPFLFNLYVGFIISAQRGT